MRPGSSTFRGPIARSTRGPAFTAAAKTSRRSAVVKANAESSGGNGGGNGLP
jgi:hypothetical protein